MHGLPQIGIVRIITSEKKVSVSSKSTMRGTPTRFSGSIGKLKDFNGYAHRDECAEHHRKCCFMDFRLRCGNDKTPGRSRHEKDLRRPQYDGIEQVSMEEIFERSDVISIHCPHTKETENLLNREAFAKMKDGVIIINTARGIIIDEEALLEALESRKVYMAGLDVVANEPPQYQIPLMQSPYTFITSHIAWQPKAARLRAVDLAVKNFRSYLEGMPTSVIN